MSTHCRATVYNLLCDGLLMLVKESEVITMLKARFIKLVHYFIKGDV